MASLELAVGTDWKNNVRYLAELPFRPLDASINLMEIRDIIDVVVGGTNVTATFEAESIFGVVSQLLESLITLAKGASKFLLEFPVEPFEMVLVPDGERLLITVYSVDRSRKVQVHDAAVDVVEFTNAVAFLAEELLAEVLKIDDRFSTDPFLRSFSADLSRVRRLGTVHFPPVEAQELSAAYGSTSSVDGLSLSFEFTDTACLTNYDGFLTFDQHALLARGQIRAEWCGQHVVLNESYPILAVHAVLRRCRELLNLNESPRSKFKCVSALEHLVFEVVSTGSRWKVTLGEGDQRVHFDTTFKNCIDGFLSFAELVLREVHRLSTSIDVNQRYADLQQEAQDLRAWFEDLSQTNIYFERPEEFIEAHAGMAPRQAEDVATFNWPFESVRALYPTRSWTFEVPRVHFAAVSQAMGRVLVPTSELLVVLDAETGDELWRASERGGVPLSSYAVAGDRLLLANERGEVWLTNAQTGEDIGELEHRGGSLLLDAAVYEADQHGVMADFHGQLRGFDMRTTETIWQHTMGHGYLTGVLFDGPIVCALSSPGFIQGIAPLTGHVLWNVKLGGVADGGPYAHQGRIYAITHDHVSRNLAIHAVQPFTGRAAWHLRLEGKLAAPPTFAGQWVVVPIERHGRIYIVGVDVESAEPSVAWSIELMSAGLDRPTPVVTFDLDGDLHGAIRTDRGEVTCFRFGDGELRWQIRPDPPGALLFRNLDMLAIRDSLLIVSETIELRSLSDGRVLHQFGDVLEAPEYMQATGNLSLIVGELGRGESTDQIMCLTLGHFLAVV